MPLPPRWDSNLQSQQAQTYVLDRAATETCDESSLSEILMTPWCKSNDQFPY
jgi:hypothetical protein